MQNIQKCLAKGQFYGNWPFRKVLRDCETISLCSSTQLEELEMDQTILVLPSILRSRLSASIGEGIEEYVLQCAEEDGKMEATELFPWP